MQLASYTPTERKRREFLQRLSRNFRLFREMADYTSQAAAARAIGCPRQRLCNIENAKVEPTMSDIWQCAIVYKREIKEFFE